MNTRNLQVKKSNKYLFKGDPKNGKSIASASFPNTYFMDLDKRIRSVAAFYPSQDFDYDWFDDIVTLDKKLDQLLIRCPYETICFDGCTTFAEMAINTMIRTRPVKEAKVLRGGIEMTQIQDFGGEQRAFDLVFDKLFMIHQKFDVNIIVTAHVIEVEKSIRPGVTIKTRSLLTAGKKVAAFLPVRFDEAYHFQVDVPLDGGEPRFECFTRHQGDDWACTTYNIPARIDFTNKSFYDELQRLRREGTSGRSSDLSESERGIGEEGRGIEGLEISSKSIGEEQKVDEIGNDDSKAF